MRKVQVVSNIFKNFKRVLCKKNVILSCGTLLKINACVTRISMGIDT
jgi:hypothetical protein